MKSPCDYEKRILLAVSGMSPQILTETLYALAVANSEPFIPTEIHLISTANGAKKANLELLHPKTGKFHQLCRDYGLENIHFTAESIIVISDENGVLLDDIKTPAQNEAAADFITRVVSRLTYNENTALHVSIAGGRKTMGYYLGYALSLYGRAQDRLSHILVTERYENLHDFFYPTPDSLVIYDRDNQALDAQEAEVMLAQIPFVRLRRGIPRELLDGQSSFNDSIRFAQRLEAEPRLIIEFATNRLFAYDLEIELTEINFAFYLWMLDETVTKAGVILRPKKPSLDYSDRFLTLYKALFSEMKDLIQKTEDSFNKSAGMKATWLSERITAVNSAFEKALGETAAQAFMVKTQGFEYELRFRQLNYRVLLTPEQIESR
jgi:CRISPR-associated protein (TIGR02584 family)